MIFLSSGNRPGIGRRIRGHLGLPPGRHRPLGGTFPERSTAASRPSESDLRRYRRARPHVQDGLFLGVPSPPWILSCCPERMPCGLTAATPNSARNADRVGRPFGSAVLPSGNTLVTVSGLARKSGSARASFPRRRAHFGGGRRQARSRLRRPALILSTRRGYPPKRSRRRGHPRQLANAKSVAQRRAGLTHPQPGNSCAPLDAAPRTSE